MWIFPGFVHVNRLFHVPFDWNRGVIHEGELLFQEMPHLLRNPKIKSYTHADLQGTYKRAGPAVKEELPNRKVDSVMCVRCTTWPSEAQEWVERARRGIPSDEVIFEVSRYIGCDLVPVSHDDNKADEFQWRYSFF